MGKKVMGSDGKMYKVKKPFYQRVWFWVLVVILIISFSGALGSSNNENASADKTTSETKQEDNTPTEYKTALRKAESYSKTMYMSKAGIYDQLTSEYGEKYSAEAAQYAIDNLQADYNDNALKKAKDYQEQMAMSPEAIRDQLTSEHGEKFTAEEADYAIQNLNE